MKNNIVKECDNEYKQRVKALQGIIISAYFDYFYLIEIGNHTKEYRENGITKSLFKPAIDLVNTIIRSIQKDLILLLCALEDDDNNANSLKHLKANLHKCIPNVQNYSKQFLKIPSAEQNTAKKARNKAIAHIEFGGKIEKVNMLEVKKRVDLLKECFNSYLIGDMIKFSVSDEDIKKMEKRAKTGVDLLLSGTMDNFYLLHKRNTIITDSGEE